MCAEIMRETARSSQGDEIRERRNGSAVQQVLSARTVQPSNLNEIRCVRPVGRRSRRNFSGLENLHSLLKSATDNPAKNLVQEIRPIKCIPLYWPEARVADDTAQFFFCSAVGHACRSHHIFFQHDRAHVVASEAQSELANF